jgi:cation diffusion facilitator CzcD-associated flavoprotein CzcO
MKDVAVKHGIDKYVKFNTKVESATWDEDAGLWRLQIVGPDGSTFEDTCNILVNGSGVLK